MHYLGHIEETEATYHVRLYSVPKGGPTVMAPGFGVPLNKWQMNAHAVYLQTQPAFEFDPSLLLSFDKIRLAAENEIRIGVPRYDNIKLTLASDPVFLGIIATLKDADAPEIWCEIVCESKATDIPDLPAGAIFFPRKKRCIFWGKCVVQSAQLAVSDQQMTPNFAQQAQHIGTLDLVFKHWLLAIATRYVDPEVPATGQSALVKQWLDEFTNDAKSNNKKFIRFSEVLYSLLSKISPTPLFAIADHTFHHPFDDSDSSIARGNVHLDITVLDQPLTHSAVNLYSLAWQLYSTDGLGNFQDFLIYFENIDHKNPGQYSFYRLKDLAEALVRITGEAKLIFQIEIPTLEEAAQQNSPLFHQNFSWLRQGHWASCTRWLFMQPTQTAKDMPDMTLITKKDTVRVAPCGAWISKIHIDEPAVFGSDTLDIGAWEANSPFDDGQELSYKTLSRFLGTIGGTDDQPRGYEIYVMGSDRVPHIARRVVFPFLFLGGSDNEDDWAKYHAKQYLMLWGNPMSILECEFEGNGLEPFGASAPKSGLVANVKKTFGFYDWGEWPLYRVLSSVPLGLVEESEDNSKGYLVIDIARTPGGDGSLKAIETLRVYSQTPLLVPPPPGSGTGDEDDTLTIDNTGNMTPSIDVLDGFTLPADSTFLVSYDIVARRLAGGSGAGAVGDSLAFAVKGSFKNIAGTVTSFGIGPETAPPDKDDDALDVNFNINGTVIEVQITTPPDTIFIWKRSKKITSV